MAKLGTGPGPRFVHGCLLAAAFCLLLLGGCSTRQSPGFQVSTPPLIVPDDSSSTPLTPAETAALNSTGQIDQQIPRDAMPDVVRQYKYFLRKGRTTMGVFSKRAEQYLAQARKVFRSRGMPEELAYLAMVESGYRPDAKSQAGAAGAWQFMPYTGMKYGLNQDWWMDERLDPYKATEAAADYLQKLYGDFNDWPTAIAAYNAGEGKISRAKQGTGGRNFYEVKARNHMLDEKAQLREETKQYVPRFIAVSKIMRNLPQLGFAPINPESAPGVLRFTARPGTDLKGLADACRMNWAEFSAYNQHHKKVITSTERSTFVYVPARYEQVASGFLRSSQSTVYADWRAVQVATSADSWDKISRRSNIPLTRLKALNPGNDQLLAGETVLVPRSVNMSATAVAAMDERPGKKGKKQNKNAGADNNKRTELASGSENHVLQPDENLYAVARKYKVRIKDLQEYNQIDDANKVRAGQVLRIPGDEATAQAKAPVDVATASQGRSNNLSGKNAAGPVKAASLPAKSASAQEKNSSGRLGTPKAQAKACSTTYTVQDRDNLWNIARKHNVSVDDLKRWNKVDEKSLRAGATLVVNLD